ncbi:hypothetical protein ACFWPV_29620 [Streptomyces uncialis]|uniref:hypothetical protein n=1 Tax=Streptomyces uncialis TaxID=1048205 RepID=UPI003664D3FE
MTQEIRPNLLLRHLMSEHGYTREGLADAVNDACERLTGRLGNCGPRLVGLWLRGQVTWPRNRTREALEAVFGRPVSEIGFRSPVSGGGADTVRRSASAPTPQEPPMLRRNFVVGLTGTLLTLPPLPAAGRLGVSDIERIRATTVELHRIDDIHGGAQLVDAAACCIEYVEAAARRCTYGSRVQNLLYQALGEMAASAAWFAFDAGQQDVARRWWDTGLRYALLARDRMLRARIWSSMSHQAYVLGHGGEAVSVARAALDETRGRRNGTLSALLHTRVAQGHALQGEQGWCARSLLRAEQEFDRTDGQPQGWLGFFSEGEVSSAAALCCRSLGQHTASVELARASLRVVKSTPFKRNHFAAHVRVGRSLAASGELDEALAAGHEALTLLPQIRSPRVEHQLRALRTTLVEHGCVGAVELSERYEAMAVCR